ncbi:hypothetical protein [Aeromonas salmonicida]|uniref:defense against restriction DarA-related protein n=1 Tax=Aeromonas salmonicida TaxID=645 RepID=UPI002330E20B|nr:hypothetical protein [Aeromonas salmonicida]WCH25181.1 hypothetical protein ONZ54_22675 [Aeromonas salmonicida]
MIYALHNGVKVVNVIDHKAAPLTRQQFLDALGVDSMMQEPATLEEIEATYLYGLAGQGEQVFTDAIVTTSNRIDRTMAGFIRVLNQALTGTEIQASDAKIGTPKKAGDVAVLSAEIPLSDGQSIFVIFHSPSNDPRKITGTDTLVAFRFLLNKRDVTHVVAPNKGRDISLKQTTLALANLAERNSTKFAAKQADNKAKAEELATLEADTDQQIKQVDLLTEQIDTLAEAHNGTTDELARVNGQLDRQVQRNEELRQALAGLEASKAENKPAPNPVPPPTPGEEAMGVLLTLQNRPNTGGKLGGFKVVNATDRLIDITPGTPGAEAIRYTWDGTGFKRRGYYLLNDGGSVPVEQMNKDNTKLSDLPEDGIRYIKQQLNIAGEFTLTNGAVIARRYDNQGGKLSGYITITERDGTMYLLGSISSQGAKMDNATSILYKEYKEGKAAKFMVKDEGIHTAELIKGALSSMMGDYGAGWRSQWDELGDNPVIALDTPLLPGEQEHDGYYIAVNLGADGKPAGTFRVLYGDGGPLTGGTEIRTKAEVQELVTKNYQEAYDEAQSKVDKQAGTEPEPPVASPVYWYGLRIRPYSPGAQPDGVVAYVAPDDVTGDPRVAEFIKDRDPRGWSHGMIAYPEPLSRDQIDHYSLEDMAAAVWTEATRAARLLELVDVVGRMVELEQTDDEIWGDLFMPKGSLTETNNPFFVDDKYEGTQLTQALQEAGYTGSVKSMVNNLIDKAREAAKPPVEVGTEPPVELPAEGGTEPPAADEPPAVNNQWDEADPAILALLEQLEALRTSEENYELYLEKMGSLIEQLETAGAVERHEPYLHKVADRLTELMEAAA